MKTFILFIALLFSLQSFAGWPVDYSFIKREYLKFEAILKDSKGDGKTNDDFYFKNMRDFKFLWKIKDHDKESSIIKILREHTDGTPDFYVTYLVSTNIIKGRKVIRRFTGPEVEGMWRSDTIDFKTHEYLVREGVDQPKIDTDDFLLLYYLKID